MMCNTKICVFIAAVLSSAAFGQRPKQCFKLLGSKQYEAALPCFNALADSNKTEIWYAKAECLSAGRRTYAQLDTAYQFAAKAQELYLLLQPADTEKMLKRYGISRNSFPLLQNRASFAAYQFVDDTVQAELSRFIASFPGTPQAGIAAERLRELEFFDSLPEARPVAFYWQIIEKYPSNHRINDVWRLYYKTYTADGELLTLEKFAINHPSYPFPEHIERDRVTAQMAERHKLDQAFTPALTHLYDAYIRLAAPKLKAMKVLQMYIRPYIFDKQWARAADTVASFADKFGSCPAYNSLLATLRADDSPVDKVKLGPGVNTTGSEFSPVLTNNDKTLYFCGKNRKGNIGGEDIFVSQFDSGQWQDATIIPGINTVLASEAPESLSPDGTRMLLFQNGDIYYSDKYLNHKNELRWADPVRLKNLNRKGWDGDASLAADGQAIIFASESGERPDPQFVASNRKDKFDIFVSLKRNGEWSEPISLGNTINSPYCDRYPYLHPDMRTLYFSSEGHGSLGGLDVFMSKRLCDTSWVQWSQPVNLGKFINTAQDDTGYKVSTDGSFAIFAGHDGRKFDIYTLSLPEEKRPEKVFVATGLVAGPDSAGTQATIFVEDLDNGQLVGEFRSDVQTGRYTLSLPAGRRYGYYISQGGFFPEAGHIDLSGGLTGTGSMSRDFTLRSIDSLATYRQTVELANIFFDTGQAKLTHSSEPELKRIAQLLINNPGIAVSVEGHTDNTGTDTYNTDLSHQRAAAVAQYLWSNGLPKAAAKPLGLGSSAPAASNETPEGRAGNRRVELRFMYRE
jgi:hypothetical protein